MNLSHLPTDEIDSTDLIVSSEPDTRTGTVMWRILAKRLSAIRDEIDKLDRAVSENGFVFFTTPHQIETGDFKYWFQSFGVTYDVL